LDAETKSPALGRFRTISVFQVEDAGTGSLLRETGIGVLEWNGCLLLGPPCTLNRFCLSETPTHVLS